jgi:ATP-binding cassette subfamily B (MDR/TAP) protein 1
MSIEPGKFTALVGPSGSGKSTLASLLLRHYDPQTATRVSELDQHILKTMKEANGEDKEEEKSDQGVVEGEGVVSFAGHDIRSLNTRWLRSQVAVVLQKPQLISGTIFDNVAAGLTGTEWEYRADTDGTDWEVKGSRVEIIMNKVKSALVKAEAWDFVQALPDGIRTKVTAGRTGVLSGGQVQRIALATALVRTPKCLLLDEATSAISADAEMNIMARLLEEQRERGMTLIVIAHRLSTIVHADKIVVMVAGRAVQEGTYDQLLEPGCPDQTFRSMALAIPMEGNTKTDTSVDTTSTRVNTPREDGTPAKQVVLELPLPPPMTSTWNAFLHVKYLLIIGIVLGMAAGAGFVVAAWLHGRAVNALNNPDFSVMRPQVDRWALWFLILAIANLIIVVIHASFLEYSGESIVGDLRRESVRALIKQDIAFFESTDHGSGSLTAAATSNPSNVGNVIGLILAQFVSSSANITATVIMSFILNWRIAVMIIPGLAVTMILGLANFLALNRFEKDISEENDRQADFIGEAINTSNMLSSLTREAETIRLFKLKFTGKVVRKKWLFLSSCALGGTQSMLLFAAALLLYWGAKQLAERRIVSYSCEQS